MRSGYVVGHRLGRRQVRFLSRPNDQRFIQQYLKAGGPENITRHYIRDILKLSKNRAPENETFKKTFFLLFCRQTIFH